MPTNLDELAKHLDDEGLKYQKRPDKGDILTGFRMNAYKDTDGEQVLRLVVRPEENGTYMRVFAPFVYQVKPDAPHKDAAFQALVIANYRTRMVQFEYDPNDGEVCCAIEWPVEDGTVTRAQLKRCLHGIAAILDDTDPFIRAAMETGVVDHAGWTPGLPPEIAALMRLVQRSGGLDAAKKALEEAAKGKPGSTPPSSGKGPEEI